MVSGLGREIPSPNGNAIKGAIQTDAAINAGKFPVEPFHKLIVVSLLPKRFCAVQVQIIYDQSKVLVMQPSVSFKLFRGDC